MLGTVLLTATALGKLGDPEGEVVLTKAVGRHGVIQMIPTLSPCSFDKIEGYSSRLMLRSLGVEKRILHLPFAY